jgi:hypothetical protein
MASGFLGALVLALFFGVTDLMAGDGFFRTAAALGGPLVGASGTPPTETLPAVFAYNGVHLLLFVGAGLAFAWMILETERHPTFGWYLAAIAFVAGVFFNLVLVGAFGYEAVEGWEPPWTRIVVAMALAAGAMGAYFWRTHSGLWTTLEEKARSGAEE